MAVSTAGPSRIQQHRQPSTRYSNFFKSTGQRRSTKNLRHTLESSQALHTDYFENQPYMQNYNPDFENQVHPDQNLGFDQNFENTEENVENFQNLASNLK